MYHVLIKVVIVIDAWQNALRLGEMDVRLTFHLEPLDLPYVKLVLVHRHLENQPLQHLIVLLDLELELEPSAHLGTALIRLLGVHQYLNRRVDDLDAS